MVTAFAEDEGGEGRVSDETAGRRSVTFKQEAETSATEEAQHVGQQDKQGQQDMQEAVIPRRQKRAFHSGASEILLEKGVQVARPQTTWTSAMRTAFAINRRGPVLGRSLECGQATIAKEHWSTPPRFGHVKESSNKGQKITPITAFQLMDLGIGYNGEQKGLGVGSRFPDGRGSSLPGPTAYTQAPMTEPQPSAKYHNQPAFTMGSNLSGKKGIATVGPGHYSPHDDGAPPHVVVLMGCGTKNKTLRRQRSLSEPIEL